MRTRYWLSLLALFELMTVQWDGTTNSWTKVGQVVDAVGQGRKQLYAGKEYDYVFDVDIQDGVPPLKLPYNVTGMFLSKLHEKTFTGFAENPYTAAQRFLHANELSLNYLDEVVRFIETNTAGVNIGTGGEEYQDPYTGMPRLFRLSRTPLIFAYQARHGTVVRQVLHLPNHKLQPQRTWTRTPEHPGIPVRLQRLLKHLPQMFYHRYELFAT